MGESMLVLATVPFALLVLYATGHVVLLAGFLLARPRRAAELRSADGVTVLIPARDEGARAVLAIRSLLEQDHDGPVDVLLLVRNRQDSSVAHLEAAFGTGWPERRPGVHLLSETTSRSAGICFTGSDPKHAKVNWAVAGVTTPYVAILDCDHEARSDWLSTSIAVAEAKGVEVVQARREPSGIFSLFGFWDALHQHIGCEVTNLAYDTLGLGVFFSGTTAVLRTSVLQERPLRDCLTEDTDLSYAITARGWRIGYNPASGSMEDVSPDLYSFLARRRRWAHGHTEAFLRHLGPVLHAGIPIRRKLQFLLHGLHYSAVLPIVALHLLIGAYFASRLPWGVLALVALGTSAAVFAMLRSQPPGGRLVGTMAVGSLALWLGPAVVLVMNLAVALLGGDPELAMLPVPLGWLLFGAATYILPVLTVVLGLLRLEQASLSNLFVAVASYPVMLYLDVAGVLLGLVDWAIGGAVWHRIARSDPHVAGTGLQPFGIGAMARAFVADTGGAMRLRHGLIALVSTSTLIAGAWWMVRPVQLPVADRPCRLLEQDRHPWIKPPDDDARYCVSDEPRFAQRTGSFGAPRTQRNLAGTGWDVLEDTFPCNLAMFHRDNVAPLPDGGLRLTVSDEPTGDRAFRAGSVATTATDHLYGRYEVELKVARGAGLVTAFFLYRFDPWQEIDVEFLGQDTTSMMVNVFYNPGVEGDLYNYGFYGTPALIELGFDAADDLHRYAVEWDPNEIRWFVDDVLVHARPAGQPTPTPHLPMRFHLNTWPICSEVIAGAVDREALPATSEFRSVTFEPWEPPLVGPFRETLDAEWRVTSDWVQPPL